MYPKTQALCKAIQRVSPFQEEISHLVLCQKDLDGLKQEAQEGRFGLSAVEVQRLAEERKLRIRLFDIPFKLDKRRKKSVAVLRFRPWNVVLGFEEGKHE